jgi:hypothetical protein
MGFLGLVNCAIWPTAVARALAMDSPRAVKRQYTFSSISFLIRFLIPYLWGICAYVFIMQHPGMRELFFPGAGGVGRRCEGGRQSVRDALVLGPDSSGRFDRTDDGRE